MSPRALTPERGGEGTHNTAESAYPPRRSVLEQASGAQLDLARAQSFKGLVATRGADALEIARNYTLAAVSLDIFLPDMLGWTILSHLKQDAELRHIPVQIVTVDEERLYGLERGRADGFFVEGYKILEQLGKGQMGGVYKAVHALGQVVAVGDDDQSDTVIGSRCRRVSRKALCHVHCTPLAFVGQVVKVGSERRLGRCFEQEGHGRGAGILVSDAALSQIAGAPLPRRHRGGRPHPRFSRRGAPLQDAELRRVDEIIRGVDGDERRNGRHLSLPGLQRLRCRSPAPVPSTARLISRREPAGLDPRVIKETLHEVAACRNSGILINTFMLARDPVLVQFVAKVCEMAKGKAYFTNTMTLGEYVMKDFMKRRTRRVR